MITWCGGVIIWCDGDGTSRKFSLERLTVSLAALGPGEPTVLRQRIEKELSEWHGDTPQTDDVLLIGIAA